MDSDRPLPVPMSMPGLAWPTVLNNGRAAGKPLESPADEEQRTDGSFSLVFPRACTACRMACRRHGRGAPHVGTAVGDPVRPPHASPCHQRRRRRRRWSSSIAGVISARARAGHGVARWNRCNLPRESSVKRKQLLLTWTVPFLESMTDNIWPSGLSNPDCNNRLSVSVSVSGPMTPH